MNAEYKGLPYFTVESLCFDGEWTCCWDFDNRFETRQDAEQALEEEMEDAFRMYLQKVLSEPPRREDYRIREVTGPTKP